MCYVAFVILILILYEGIALILPSFLTRKFMTPPDAFAGVMFLQGSSNSSLAPMVQDRMRILMA